MSECELSRWRTDRAKNASTRHLDLNFQLGSSQWRETTAAVCVVACSQISLETGALGHRLCQMYWPRVRVLACSADATVNFVHVRIISRLSEGVSDMDVPLNPFASFPPTGARAHHRDYCPTTRLPQVRVLAQLRRRRRGAC